MLRIQLNTRVKVALVTRLRAEAKRSNRTQDCLLEFILGDFYKNTSADQRKRMYAKLPEKRAART